MAAVIDHAVSERLLAAVAPDQIELALTAADTVTERATRATRAVELRVERARYDAARAERAFHRCDPDNRLVARSLEQRWEAKLRDLADAEAELARQAATPQPPARADIEALARDLPRLWAAPSTSQRDRKRLLRALINDVTLTSQPDDPHLQVGIHWRSGASDQLTVLRPQAARSARAYAVFEILRELGPTHTHAQLAEHLNQTGWATASGRPFTEESVRWMRWKHRIPSPLPATRRRDRRPRTRATPRRRRPRHLRLDPPRQAPRPPRRPPQARDPLQRRDRGRLPPTPRRLTPNPLSQLNNR